LVGTKGQGEVFRVLKALLGIVGTTDRVYIEDEGEEKTKGIRQWVSLVSVILVANLAALRLL